MKEKESGTKYQETKQHGSRLFPFNIYPCSIPVDFSHVALHWHEEMEIIAVKKGKGRITVDTVSYPVEEGDILAVFPGQLHATFTCLPPACCTPCASWTMSGWSTKISFSAFLC